MDSHSEGDSPPIVKLENPITVDSEYITLEDPASSSSDIVRKVLEAMKVRIRIHQIDLAEASPPFISGLFSQWREEFVDKLLAAMPGFSIHQKAVSIQSFAETTDNELFDSYYPYAAKAYRQYAAKEKLCYRVPFGSEYEVIVEEMTKVDTLVKRILFVISPLDSEMSGLEQEIVDECGDWMLRVDTLLELLSRCVVYNIFTSDKLVLVEVARLQHYQYTSRSVDLKEAVTE